jgi:hypothetical protein
MFRYPIPMRPMLATAHYATRKGLNRPFARVTARDRRMGHKLRYYGADAPSVPSGGRQP